MLPSLAWALLAATGWDPLARVSGIACVAVLAELGVRSAVSEVLGGRTAPARLLARLVAAARHAGARTRLFVSPATVVVGLACAFYAAWMSWTTILAHRHFGTAAFELGNSDTMFFNALHGHPFRRPGVIPTGPSWAMLGVHVELTMLALLPLYALRPGAETLLVLQAVAVASGALPLYRFAARRLPRAAALGLALAYLLYAPLHEATFYEFHLAPFAVAFTLWAVSMLDARRPALFALFFTLALGCREDVAVGFAVLGVYLLLRGKHTRAALVMTVVSVATFVVLKLIVMPHFQGSWFASVSSDPTETYGYRGAVRTLVVNPVFAWRTLVNPEKLALLVLLLAPVAFLPLRRRLLWMSLLPAVPFAMVMPGYGPSLQTSFQNVLPCVPFLFLAAALALAATRAAPNGRARLAGALGGIAMATFLTTRVWGAMPPGDQNGGGFHDIPELRAVSATETLKARDLAELVAKVPKDAVLAVSEKEYAHVSARLDCLLLRSGYAGADYILYDEDSGGAGADTANRALGSGTFTIVERRPASRLGLLRRKGR